MNDRISKLKDIIINSQNEICVERGLAITKSYKQTEGEPVIIRRGKALKCILEEMSIYIDDGELIVGNQAFHPFLDRRIQGKWGKHHNGCLRRYVGQ